MIAITGEALLAYLRLRYTKIKSGRLLLLLPNSACITRSIAIRDALNSMLHIFLLKQHLYTIKSGRRWLLVPNFCIFACRSHWFQD